MNMYLSPLYRTRRYPASAGFFNDDFFRAFFGGADTARTMKVDILEKDDSYEIQAELPGIDPGAIDLTYQNDILTIAAKYEDTTGDDTNNRRYTERRSGSFSRSFRVEGIREEDITASSKNGILTVTLPKAEPATQGLRRIPISESL